MKSNFATTILILILISTIFGCNPRNNNVVVFRGNLERTGVYDASSKIPLGEIKWKYNTETEYLSSPIISQGVVYITGAGGNLFALNASTGEKNWIFQGEKWAGSSPSLSESTAYFGSMDNSVYAIDIKTSHEKWKFKTGNYVFSSPAVLDGLVYFGNYDGYFYAVNAETGQEKWKFKTQGTGFLAPGREPATDYEFKGAVHSSPAIVESSVYFGSYDHYLYALDAKTGQKKWKFKTDDVIISTPAISDNVLYFGSGDGDLYAINTDGQEKWEFNTKDFLTIPSQAIQTRLRWISSPTIADGFVYFSVSYQWWENSYEDGSNNLLNYLFAVNIATGQLKWRIQAASNMPTVSNNILYYGNDEGYVFALYANSGQEIWKFKADSGIVSDVVVVNGTAYFCSKDGFLYALQ